MNTLIALWGGCWAVVAYAYIVFPLLLALYVRLKRGMQAQSTLQSPRQETALLLDGDLPHITMLVAAHNEEAVLEAKLANTWALDYPAHLLTLRIGSDGSGDGTNALLHACDDKRLQAAIFEERRGKISVLNDLIAQTDDDIVVMSDANTMYAPDALRRLAAPFADAGVGCVSGELRLANEGGVSGEGIYWSYECWIKRNESEMGFLIGCNGGIFALRRELYQALPASTIVEDFVISMGVLAQGYAVRYVPGAYAVEPACASAQAEMTRKIRIGAGNFQALSLIGGMLHPRYGARAFAFWSHKVLRWLVPMFWLIALVLNLALIRHPFFAFTLAVEAVSGLLAVCAYRGARVPRLTRPISYFYLMNYALFCGFLRYVSKTQRVTWERAGSPANSVSAQTAQETGGA